ncbi:MAG TPA: hypothetical protein VKV20_00935 [Ktedonobacteraceae bacterium]|jgi:hypothetical protein|nr:hypothetical protein [Ktedonobacteraceae bacterium]
MKLYGIRRFVAGLAIIALMALFSACAGVSTSGGNGNLSLSGSVVSVNVQNHSVTLEINGQQKTINGLTDQEVSLLQGQVGKVYSIQVTQNGDGSYEIVTGTQPMAEDTPETGETPGTNQTPEANEPGSINFTGRVLSASGSSITVSLPDGSSLTMGVVNGQTDESDFNGQRITNGELIQVEATANADGSFLASKLSPADSGDAQDQNVVDFQGVTTSAVGSDHVIHFAVGNKSFSYTIGANADLSDFHGNPQSIAKGVSVKVEVTFNGTVGAVTKVGNVSNS